MNKILNWIVKHEDGLVALVTTIFWIFIGVVFVSWLYSFISFITR